MADMGKHFSSALEAALRTQGYKRYKLSKESGISQSLLSKYALGKALPSDDSIQKMADVLGVPFDALWLAAEADRKGLASVEELRERVSGVKTPKPWSHHDLSHSSAGNRGIDFNSTGRSFNKLDVTNAHAEDKLSINSDAFAQIPGAIPFAGLPMARVPLYGSASCGSPQWVSDTPEDFIELPAFMVEGIDGSMAVKGQSMTQLGYREGDLIFFRRLDGELPESGDEVIASVGGECTCKIFERKSGMAYLRSAPVAGDPDIIPITDQVRLVAVVVSVMSWRKK